MHLAVIVLVTAAIVVAVAGLAIGRPGVVLSGCIPGLLALTIDGYLSGAVPGWLLALVALFLSALTVVVAWWVAVGFVRGVRKVLDGMDTRETAEPCGAAYVLVDCRRNGDRWTATCARHAGHDGHHGHEETA